MCVRETAYKKPVYLKLRSYTRDLDVTLQILITLHIIPGVCIFK